MDTSKKEYSGECLLDSLNGLMKCGIKTIIFKIMLIEGKQLITVIISYIFYLCKIDCFYCHFKMIKQKWLWVSRSFVWNKPLQMQNISTITRYNKNGDSKNRCPVVLSLFLIGGFIYYVLIRWYRILES